MDGKDDKGKIGIDASTEDVRIYVDSEIHQRHICRLSALCSAAAQALRQLVLFVVKHRHVSGFDVLRFNDVQLLLSDLEMRVSISAGS